jgi:DNA-binding Lrp family transcriptional regulator
LRLQTRKRIISKFPLLSNLGRLGGCEGLAVSIPDARPRRAAALGAEGGARIPAEVTTQRNDIEHKVLAALQDGLPKSRTPYCDLARRIGISTSELLAVLERWRRDGTIRRIGAIVNHFRVGLTDGAMVVWRVEPGRVDDVGAVFASFEEVSHAYERQTAPGWEYNFYTMVHARTPEAVRGTVERMSRAAGVSDYLILSTRKELKKVAPKYV